MIILNLDNTAKEIPILPDGTPAYMGDPYVCVSYGKITKKATAAQLQAEGWFGVEGQGSDISYWFEFASGSQPRWVGRSSLYPAYLEES